MGRVCRCFAALCDMHPMRALFLIPRNPPPRLKSKKWSVPSSYCRIDASRSKVSGTPPETLSSPVILFSGPRSSSASSRAVWWRTTRSGRPPTSSWSIPSSGTSPTRGRCASSSKTTWTAAARSAERKVGVRVLSPQRVCWLVLTCDVCLCSDCRWDRVRVQRQWGRGGGSSGAGGRAQVWRNTLPRIWNRLKLKEHTQITDLFLLLLWIRWNALRWNIQVLHFRVCAFWIGVVSVVPTFIT